MTAYLLHHIRLLLTSVILFGFIGGSYGQDPHFSQFFMNKLYHNPATTSLGTTDYTFSTQYRKQWGWLQNAFRTQAVNGEIGLLPDQNHLNRLGTGLIILQDQAGSSQMKILEARGSVAYHLPVSRNDLFSAGLAVGYVQSSINFDQLKWDAQYNGAGYDPSLETKENLNNDKAVNIDFSLGLFWTHRSKKNEWNCGYSAHHYRQNQSLLEGSNSPMQMRHVALASYSVPLTYVDLVADAKFIRQAGAMEIEGGGRIVYRLGGDSRYTNFRTSSNVFAGLYLRHMDAIIPSVGFEYQKMFTLCITYDITLSQLHQSAGTNGGLEFILIYRGNFSTPRRSLEK